MGKEQQFILSGENYIGQWENGKYNGKGMYIYPDGKQITGYWKTTI